MYSFWVRSCSEEKNRVTISNLVTCIYQSRLRTVIIWNGRNREKFVYSICGLFCSKMSEFIFFLGIVVDREIVYESKVLKKNSRKSKSELT